MNRWISASRFTEMSFAANFAAESTEYIVIGAILVLILALAFVTLFNTLQQKLLDVNSSL